MSWIVHQQMLQVLCQSVLIIKWWDMKKINVSFTSLYQLDSVVHNHYYLLTLHKALVKTKKYWYTRDKKIEKNNELNKLVSKNVLVIISMTSLKFKKLFLIIFYYIKNHINIFWYMMFHTNFWLGQRIWV